MTDTEPKRSLFTKPPRAFTKPPVSKSQSFDVFGRNDIYADILAAKAKKKAERAAKEKAKAERVGRETKRRRISDEHEDEDDESSDVPSGEDSGNEGTATLEREREEKPKKSATRRTPKKEKVVPARDLKSSPRTPPSLQVAKSVPVIEIGDDDDEENEGENLYGTVQKISPVQVKQPAPKPTHSDPPSEDEDEDEYTKQLKERAREKARLRKLGIDVGQAKSPTAATTDAGLSLSPAPRQDQSPADLVKSPLYEVTSPVKPGISPTVQDAPDDPAVSLLIRTIIPNTKPLIINRRASHPLHAVRMFWCKSQNFDAAQTARVFLTWRGTRLYDTSTMTGILKLIKEQRPGQPGDPSHGKIELEAMTDEIMQHRQRQKARALEEEFGTADHLLSPNLDDNQTAEGNPDLESEAHFIIRLQAPGLEEMMLKVRPSTTIAKIMSGFKKMRRIDESKTCWLVFDGDRLEPESTVAQTEIEAGDVLEVLVR